MTTTIQLTTGVLTGEVRDVANPATPITAGGFVTDTIPNRGPNDTILLSLEGESANSAASVVSTYGGLVFTPNAVDAPTLGTWTYYLNPTAAETIALGANPPPTTETFTITYITRDDNGSETGSYEATIVVTIAGKDDPVQSIRYVNPTDDTADISIDEDASTGDIVGEVVITDTDTEVDDSNGNSDVPAFTITAISYVDENGDTQSFTGESPFGFDEATGNIIVVGDLDYESINQYTLTITATDATDTSIVTPPVTVTINVRDVNEAPTLSASSVSGAINENVVAGTKVTGITFAAEDVDAGDNPTYHIIGGDGMSVFDIADDGTIILKDGATLDYESTKSYTLIAEARDPEGLKSDPVTVTIEIGNELEINNNVPFAPISINENDTSLSFTVTPVEAKFEDSPFPWITDPVKVGTVYSIDSGGDGLFTIDRTSGIVTLTGALDYETKEQYEVVVRADVGEEHATTTLIINVRDVNEAPTLSASSVSGTINENVVAGTKVTGITFTAEDVDVGDNPTYHIIGGDGMSVFDIADDGTIILKGSATLDYESTKSYTLIAEARDPEGLKSDPVTVTIEIGNELEINNNVPFAPISIDENETSLSFTVTPVEAKFEDSPFPWITDPVKVGTIYSIDSGGDGLFTIGRTSGVVTLTGALDYETKEQYEVVVRADVGNEYATTTLTINVRDVYEAPTISGGKIITIAENDADADLNTIFEVDGNIVTGLEEDDFTITGEHSENFRVAKNTNGEWQLELTSALDFEAVRDNADDTEADFDLQIAITDDRGNSATQTINVNVTDVNDAPVLVANQARVSLAEQVATTAPVDTGITFTASDADANTSFAASDFTVSGANGNVDRRFEVVADGNDWKLQLKAGRWLDYRVADDRSIDLTVKVNDGVHDSEDIAVTVNVTDVANNAPYWNGASIASGGRIEEGTATSSVHTGHTIRYTDRDSGTVFTPDSFIITDADGNIDNRFEMVAGASGWDLHLKAGGTLDYDNVADRSIDLTVRVSDGINVSWGRSTPVFTVLRIDGNEDSNVIRGSDAPENIYAYGSGDIIYGGAGIEWIRGGLGDDTIYGGTGDDSIFGEDGEDTLYGGAGDDFFNGNDDDDTVYGGAGDDTLYGGSDNDTLYGGAGRDWLVGNYGVDMLYGGEGIDLIYGNQGNDLFYLDAANAKEGKVNGDVVFDFSRDGILGVDRLLVEVSKTDKAVIDGLATDQEKFNKLKDLTDIRWEKAHANIASYHLDDRQIQNTIIYDTRDTNGTDDDIILMVLEDFVDDLTFEMFDIIVEDVKTGTSSVDTILGAGRNSMINGGSGADTIYGDAGNDIIRGESGNDILYGGEDKDFLYGGNNNDTLYGGEGIDILYGNSGNDRFVLDSILYVGTTDVDIVADFSRSGNGGIDVIRVDTPDGNEASFAALGLYVKHGSSKALTGHETDENHASTMDTVIYKIVGQTDTASNGETDDVALMIIEDYVITDSVSDFAAMVEVV